MGTDVLSLQSAKEFLEILLNVKGLAERFIAGDHPVDAASTAEWVNIHLAKVIEGMKQAIMLAERS